MSDHVPVPTDAAPRHALTRRARATARRLATVVGALMLTLALVVLPAAATEGGTGEEREKIQLPQTARDRVGLILIGVGVVLALGALDNARRQLKGEREQASGEFRWR